MKLIDIKHHTIKTCPLKYLLSKYTASMSEICFGRIMERSIPKSGDIQTSKPKEVSPTALDRHG